MVSYTTTFLAVVHGEWAVRIIVVINRQNKLYLTSNINCRIVFTEKSGQTYLEVLTG